MRTSITAREILEACKYTFLNDFPFMNAWLSHNLRKHEHTSIHPTAKPALLKKSGDAYLDVPPPPDGEPEVPAPVPLLEPVPPVLEPEELVPPDVPPELDVSAPEPDDDGPPVLGRLHPARKTVLIKILASTTWVFLDLVCIVDAPLHDNWNRTNLRTFH